MPEQSTLLKPSTNLNENYREEVYQLLSIIHTSPHLTQREFSKKLNISLGKTNYLLQSLIKKGLIKIKNFSHNPGKLKKVQYLLTKKGWQEKLSLTYHFLKRKEEEYNRIKEDWEQIKNAQYGKFNIQ